MQLLQKPVHFLPFLTSPHTFPPFLLALLSSLTSLPSYFFPLFSNPPSLSLSLSLSLSRSLCVSLSPSAALSFGFICMAERKGCRQCEQGQAEPSCVHPGQGLRFVMLDNTRQCGDKKTPRPAADKKSLVFSPSLSTAYCLLLARRRRILRVVFFLDEWRIVGRRGGGGRRKKPSSAQFDILVQSIFCVRPSECLIFPWLGCSGGQWDQAGSQRSCSQEESEWSAFNRWQQDWGLWFVFALCVVLCAAFFCGPLAPTPI